VDAPVSSRLFDGQVVDAHQTDSGAGEIGGAFHAQSRIPRLEAGPLPEQGIVRLQQEALLPLQREAFEFSHANLPGATQVRHEDPPHEKGQGDVFQGPSSPQLVARGVQVGS